LGKTTKFVLAISTLILIACLFISCSSKDKQNIQVDTVSIVKFTDEKINIKNNVIIQKSVSQRTNDITSFIVEYWYKTTNESEIYHYGYLVKLENEEIVIIKEGKDVNNKISLD